MKIIMLAGQGKSTRFIYNGIAKEVYIEKVLLTSPASKKKLLKGRIKKLGVLKVLNQLLFQTLFVKGLRFSSKRLLQLKKEELGLKDDPIPAEKTIYVGSVNSQKTMDTLKELNPDVVLVNGTAIIQKKVLEAAKAVFINTHVGITPEYRGVHGGYWALRNQDAKRFGVTIHKIDTGIDTGDIIYQATGTVDKKDNFLTYPLLQIALAIPLLKKTFKDLEVGKLKAYKKEQVHSKLYYHPTFTGYLWGRIKYGIK